jgi:antitoxin component YwqK of YwqJK toxin-antitoxin module
MFQLTTKFALSILYLSIISLILTCCSFDDTPKNNLVVKDKLLYRKGSDTPFTGREKARIQNKIVEYDVVNGIKHGDFRLYFEDGTLEMKGQLDSNKNAGKWQYFYQSGVLESEGYFVEDMPEGRWVWYFTDGKLREEGSYHKGKRVGWWKQFDKSGNLFSEVNLEYNDSLAIHDSLAGGLKDLGY